MSLLNNHDLFKFPIIKDIKLFFHFIGQLICAQKQKLPEQRQLMWLNFLRNIYYSGAKMTIPLMIISSLMGASLVVNIYKILSPFYLQDQVLLVAQNILFYDLLPFIIGLVLSIQQALNLVNAYIKKPTQSNHDILSMYVFPLILGCNFSALLLYVYTLNAILISIYFCFRLILKTDVHEYLFHLSTTFTSINILYSILKTLIYCTIVSLVVGYYYYAVALAHLTLRQAMSRIMTRSLLYLTISSIYFKFFSY